MSSLLKWAFILYGVLSLGSMATMSIGAVLLIVAILAAVLAPGRGFHALRDEFKKEWKHKPFQIYFKLSLFLTLACALSLICGVLVPLSYEKGGVEVHFFADMAKAWYLFWPLLMVVGLRRLSAADRESVIRSWIVAFGVLSVVGIIQYFTGWPRPQGIPDYPNRYHATLFLGHHLSVASIFIFPFFVCLDLFVQEWRRVKDKTSARSVWFWIFGVSILLGLTTLFLTFSRTLWVALPFGILVWLVWALPRKVWISLLSLAVVAGGILLQTDAVQKRIHVGMGIGTREELWRANLEFFKQRPLTGVGWRHNQELSGYYLMEKYHTSDVFSGHAHNNLVDMLGGTGALGTIAWVLWCIGVIWILFQKQSKKAEIPFKRALICAWIVFQINGLTQVNFWEAKVEHQIAWMVAWSLL